MGSNNIAQLLGFILCIICCVCSLGCPSGSADPVGPEKNAIQNYLDENPDQLVDDEEVSEEDEFAAGGVE
ncbi:MAG: hypothetical protein AAF664_22535 [Planctomycetota bacterium]